MGKHGGLGLSQRSALPATSLQVWLGTCLESSRAVSFVAGRVGPPAMPAPVDPAQMPSELLFSRGHQRGWWTGDPRLVLQGSPEGPL